jgi:cytochrome c biogenesis protein CcmG, thiol:disulfide interchange protein DsbE
VTGRRGFAVLGLAALIAGCTSEPDTVPTAPENAPAAVATDLPPCPEQEDAVAPAGAPDLAFDCLGGGTLDLRRAPGSPTVLNLWATWCAPCREELPLIQQFAEEAGDRVRVIGVNSQDGVPQATSFAEDAGLGFPIAYDGDGELAAQLGLNVLPFTVFVAADGSVTHVQAAVVRSVDELRSLVAQHLGVQL